MKEKIFVHVGEVYFSFFRSYVICAYWPWWSSLGGLYWR